jgi:hypothetical protein
MKPWEDILISLALCSWIMGLMTILGYVVYSVHDKFPAFIIVVPIAGAIAASCVFISWFSVFIEAVKKITNNDQ